ncbi:hypothetical protein NA78x_004526 [Anatilimnocola sp. NA78]|uniref:hypothetical protein n=1 Tax=Anatilimnocola sp. NA78 TaxID=3415683 RepID=UPI003CE55872
MLHRFVAGMVVAGCLLVTNASNAQETGLPGPEGGTKVYDVTVIGLVGGGNGTYTFTSEGMGTEEPTTSALVALEGTFTGVVNDVTTTGTFTGQGTTTDAAFMVNGTSTAGTVTITGAAGVDYVFGIIRTQPTTSTGRLRFLRALLNTSIVIGSAAAEEPPTEEPPMEEPPPTETMAE